MTSKHSNTAKTQRAEDGNTQPPPITVGIGASAGGLEAFQALLSSLGDNPGFALVFVQHLDPTAESLLPALLRTSTTMTIVEISGPTQLESNTVYICPPQTLLDLHDGLVSCQASRAQRQSGVIDHFFNSIAENLRESSIGVVLSGSGTDGTLGLKAISDHGGLTFAQDVISAKFESMPRSAATTGVADHVLSPDDIAQELLKYAQHLANVKAPSLSQKTSSDIKDAIPRIADRLMKVTQHNFFALQTEHPHPSNTPAYAGPENNRCQRLRSSP